MSSPSSKNTKSNAIKQTTYDFDGFVYDPNQDQDQDWWVDTFLHEAMDDNGYNEEGWVNEFLQRASNNYDDDSS